MQEKILALAAGLTGAGEEEQELLCALCAAAAQMWGGRLRPGLTPEECGEVFACAVAFTAAADLAGGAGETDISSFSAGEISVKKASAAQRSGAAKMLRQTAERLMAPFAEAEDFCFRGVRG